MKLPILRNTQNDDMYSWDGEKYKNLRTGVEGAVDDETAKKVFVINTQATILMHEFPLVEELVSRLNFTFDNYKK